MNQDARKKDLSMDEPPSVIPQPQHYEKNCFHIPSYKKWSCHQINLGSREEGGIPKNEDLRSSTRIVH